MITTHILWYSLFEFLVDINYKCKIDVINNNLYNNHSNKVFKLPLSILN